MSNDKELLELAAKAAGIRIGEYVALGVFSSSDGLWSPLNDDGDALCLAVKLNITVSPGMAKPPKSSVWTGSVSADIYAATRRSIVCVAAEIERNKRSGSEV